MREQRANCVRVVAALLLILITSAAGIANRSVQDINPKLSAREEREVREFARRVAANIKKTRDLSPYLNTPPASNLFYKVIADPDDSAGLVDKDVARKVGSHELQRFYIVLWNLTYLSDSYVFSRFLIEIGRAHV